MAYPQKIAALHDTNHRGKTMGLRLKFNLALLFVFALGFAVSGYLSYNLLHKNAREEVLRNAGVMMEAALSMRQYTVSQVRDKLVQKEDEFLPQTVPAFAATEMMNQLRKKYPDYAYKEAALNPTNPRDRAVAWEADVVNQFRNEAGRLEISGTRVTPEGVSLYLARPFQIKDPACLSCHTTPEMAPVAMVKRYGSDNGFGWQLNEVIGAQMVSVPMSLPIRNANRAFQTFMASLGGVFAALFIILNLMLYILIVRPVRRVVAAADRLSIGRTSSADREIPELPESGKDELAVLARSFNRMRRNLEDTIRMMDKR
jgi:protein-histidine pros-kinase